MASRMSRLRKQRVCVLLGVTYNFALIISTFRLSGKFTHEDTAPVTHKEQGKNITGKIDTA